MTSRDTVALAVGLLCIASGFFFSLTWDSIIDSQVTKQLILSESSKTYEAWIKTPVPVYMRFYFWNWTNPSDMKGDEKPVLTEMGPYTFREVIEKVDIVWNDNGTITHKQKRWWYFEPELSNGSLNDSVTTLNVVAKSAAFVTRNSNRITKTGVNIALMTQTLHVTKMVRELLFEGYRNALMDTANRLPIFSGMNVPYDRFGWFYMRNGTTDWDGVFNIETGENGMENFGAIRYWNYNNSTKFFEDECGAVRGSGGQFFPPKRTKEDVLEMFSPDLCRFIRFNYAREEEIAGILGYRYETPANLFDNGETDKDNSCFCGGECPPAGAQNVSACRLGAPGFVSYPHFYGANPSYLEGVVGMKPDPQRHGVHITMEPTYGIPLQVEARFQINILVQPFEALSMYNGVKRTYFPMLWFEQAVLMPEETTAVFRMLLMMPFIGTVTAAILLVTGICLVTAVIVGRFIRGRRKIPSPHEENKSVIEPMIYANGKQHEEEPAEFRKWNTNL